MTEQFTTARDLLQRRRAEITDLIGSRQDAAGLEQTQAEAPSDTSDGDQHRGHVASETTERGVVRSTIEALRAKQSDIDRALSNIDDGTYGRCEICQEPIEEGRLEAIPEAMSCMNHGERAGHTTG